MLKKMYDYHIGNTPLRKLPDINSNQISIKMEGDNFLGSIKARTGYYLINNLPDEADGKIIMEGQEINISDLTTRIEEKLRTWPNLTFLLSIDSDCAYQNVVDVISTIRKCRVENFSFRMTDK